MIPVQSANLGVLRANGRPGPHQGQAPAQHGQQSAQCRQGVQGSAQAQWTTLDWWPPLGWWPDAARDLLPPVPESAMASATFVLPARPDSVHCSRSFATGTLSGWCLPELRENMELVVSELCTNAIRHGLRLTPGGAREPEAIRLSLVRRGGLVVCAIGDPGSAAPVLRDPASLEPGGLGLHIVESLSLRWGWAPLAPYGKVVWAVLSG